MLALPVHSRDTQTDIHSEDVFPVSLFANARALQATAARYGYRIHVTDEKTTNAQQQVKKKAATNMVATTTKATTRSSPNPKKKKKKAGVVATADVLVQPTSQTQWGESDDDHADESRLSPFHFRDERAQSPNLPTHSNQHRINHLYENEDSVLTVSPPSTLRRPHHQSTSHRYDLYQPSVVAPPSKPHEMAHLMGGNEEEVEVGYDGRHFRKHQKSRESPLRDVQHHSITVQQLEDFQKLLKEQEKVLCVCVVFSLSLIHTHI